MEHNVGFSIATDSNDEISLTFTSIMDLSVAEDLRLTFLDCLARGKTISIMAGEVERITTPCLQVLLALKTKASEKQIGLFFPEMSESFQIALKDIGLEDQFTSLEQKA